MARFAAFALAICSRRAAEDFALEMAEEATPSSAGSVVVPVEAVDAMDGFRYAPLEWTEDLRDAIEVLRSGRVRLGCSGEARPSVDCLERLFTEDRDFKDRLARGVVPCLISRRGALEEGPGLGPGPCEVDSEDREDTLASLGRGVKVVDDVETRRVGLSYTVGKGIALGVKSEEEALKMSALSALSVLSCTTRSCPRLEPGRLGVVVAEPSDR